MIQTGQLILALSILVVLHELGHFIPAKLFKMRVEKFYLFFNPYFSIFKIRKGETEYGLGWLPLGGYVKISGMIDESMDKEAMDLPPQPWEFRSKPAWQRLITMLGGIVVNIILGFVIFVGIFYYYGDKYLPLNALEHGIYADPILREIGFQNGDKIIKLNKEAVTDKIALEDLSWKVLMKETNVVTVIRGDKEVLISIPEDIDTKLLANKDVKLFDAPVPFLVDYVLPDGNAILAGFKKGDRITSVNGVATNSYQSAVENITANAGKDVVIETDRYGVKRKLRCHISSEGKIGVAADMMSGMMTYKIKDKHYSFAESVKVAYFHTIDTFVKNVSQLKLLFNSNGVKHVGSVLSMRKQFAEVWHWKSFWFLTANLSLILAFFNVLPIPGLDGGHALFTIVEMITRKKPSKRFQEITQTIGMILLLSLMFFAIGNDIYNGKL